MVFHYAAIHHCAQRSMKRETPWIELIHIAALIYLAEELRRQTTGPRPIPDRANDSNAISEPGTSFRALFRNGCVFVEQHGFNGQKSRRNEYRLVGRKVMSVERPAEVLPPSRCHGARPASASSNTKACRRPAAMRFGFPTAARASTTTLTMIPGRSITGKMTGVAPRRQEASRTISS